VTSTLDAGAPLRGRLRPPGDKSISHRAILLGMLAGGPCRITGLLDGEDVLRSRQAARALGAEIVPVGPDSVMLRPPAALHEPDGVLDCGNSGTTLRLLAGILAAEDLHAVLTGDASLRRRPMGRIARPLRQLGAHVDGRDGGQRAPLAVRGPARGGASLDLPIASAQVKSAVLLAGRRQGIRVREPRRSRDHTERLLRRMGAGLAPDGDGFLVLEPTPHLAPVDVAVPGDLSAAAFWLVAGAIVPGSDVVIEGVGLNPTRAGVVDALQAMGADLQILDRREDGPEGEPIGDLRIRHGELRGTRLGGELALRALDELPVLAVAAAFATGVTTVSDAAELRVKESDRLARTAALLQGLGVAVEERPDGLRIEGGRPRGPARIDATGDHRIAMAAAVAGLAAGPVHIEGAESIRTSYPRFLADLEALRGT
jgi:3-phosphoshikimate 1-carboxyvinyltransferase